MPSQKPVVLLVEDDHHVAALEAEYLERDGCVVLAARHGRHALELLDVASPAVVVLDLMMPELDGFAFLRELAKRPGRRPPVIVVSGFEAYLAAAREARRRRVREGAPSRSTSTSGCARSWT